MGHIAHLRKKLLGTSLVEISPVVPEWNIFFLIPQFIFTNSLLSPLEIEQDPLFKQT